MKEVRAIVEESAKSFATYFQFISRLSIPLLAWLGADLIKTYLANPSDILITILLIESQILVQPEPHIVTI